MTPRISITEASPDGVRAVQALNRYVRSVVDPTVLALVEVRASILNGCAFCLDLHTREALAAGEDERRLFAVGAWRETPFFTEPERAALALTDAVTKLGDHGVPDEVWDDAAKHWSKEELTNLLIAIGTINVFNRLSIATQHQPV